MYYIHYILLYIINIAIDVNLLANQRYTQNTSVPSHVLGANGLYYQIYMIG